MRRDNRDNRNRNDGDGDGPGDLNDGHNLGAERTIYTAQLAKSFGAYFKLENVLRGFDGVEVLVR